MISIGVIKEGKQPPDSRVPLTPEACRKIMDTYPEVAIFVQSSPNRCIPDAAYEALNIPVVSDVSHCDILAGVKEVPIKDLVSDKTYFFFSHTIKQQPYNQPLMHALIEKGITMIDYETLVDDKGKRLIGFGYFAGVVGAHNGLLTYGRKHRSYILKPAHEVSDKDALIDLYSSIQFPNIKVAVTGGGKVSHGAWDILAAAGFQEVSPAAYLTEKFDYPVYTKLTVDYLYKNADGTFDKTEFYKHPSTFDNAFLPYASVTDILVNGIFWKDDIVRLFEKDDVREPSFRISVIADVACDIDGSVPLNQGASTIANPVYGIDRHSLEQVDPYIDDTDIIDIMAVDNLPNELPRDASAHFSKVFVDLLIPELLKPQSEILDRATICTKHTLTERFQYLKDYAYGK